MVAHTRQFAGPLPGQARSRPRALARWLLAVAALVVLMVVVGGITRLTESGLSITRWEPVSGILPPLTQAQWQAEFAGYQQIPEYREITGPAGMTLGDYKFIFFWEWFHRLLGRVIGMAFALPLAWFWIRGAIPPEYKLRLVALLSLGALQGVFGWVMVRSGLSGQMTDVSHFWLSIHLLTALFTLAGLVWTALDLRALAAHGAKAMSGARAMDGARAMGGVDHGTVDPAARPARLTPLCGALALVLVVQLLLGAWVAGLNAGLASDSWPLMQGRLLPEADWSRGAGWAFTHDPFLLHFLHRWWAWAAFAALFVLARIARRNGGRNAARAVQAALGLQVLLGIATVLSGVSLWIAVAHQLVGALLVAATAWAANEAGRAA